MDSFIIDLVLAILTVFSLIISIISIKISRKDKAKEYAPIIEINQSYYNGSKYEFPDVKSQNNRLKEDLTNEDFILDRRLFCLKGNTKEKNKSYFSLFINTSIEEDDDITTDNMIIGFDRLVIRNVGYSLSKIIINEITFHKDDQTKALKKPPETNYY